jgi:hypothetical protein
VVANVDRGIPFADRSIEATVHMNSRVPLAELGRVLDAGGCAWIVMPGPDDLDGVRALALGDARPLTRAHEFIGSLPPEWRVIERARVATRVTMDEVGAIDALTATWRARPSAVARLIGQRVDTALTWEIVRISLA